jgi:hypothetical protein
LNDFTVLPFQIIKALSPDSAWKFKIQGILRLYRAENLLSITCIIPHLIKFSFLLRLRAMPFPSISPHPDLHESPGISIWHPFCYKTFPHLGIAGHFAARALI